MGKKETKERNFAENIKREKVNYGPIVLALIFVAAGLAVSVICLKNLVEDNIALGNSIASSVAIGVGTLAVVAFLYIVIMYLYSKRAHAAFKKASLVLALLVASFFIRYAIAVAVEVEATGADGGVEISAAFASALYDALGGLTFEGMDTVSQLPVWESACYHGVAILAALVFFSSATLALDYPIASSVTRVVKKIFIRVKAGACAVWALLRGKHWRTAYKNGKPDVYIFDSITQDSVLLAEDIRKSYENEWEANRNDRKARGGNADVAGGAADGDASAARDNAEFAEATATVMERKEKAVGRSAADIFPFETESLKKYRAAHRRDRKEAERLYYEDALAWTPGRSCVIVFCGPECDAYDRKNSLHRRIEANNFLYLRYDFGRDIPIARGLRDSTASYGAMRPWLHCARNIHYFAFSRDESFEEKSGRKYRSEKANAQSVSDEMAALGSCLKESCALKNHMLREIRLTENDTFVSRKLWRCRLPERVCFYILSENDIDYCTYQIRLREFSEEIGRYADMIADLKLVNEAERATWKLSLAKHHNLPETIAEEYISTLAGELPDAHDFDVICGQCADSAIVSKNDELVVRILSLGFGDTARKTIASLYVNTDGNMIVDAIDKNADNIMGAFKRTHPSVLCLPAASGNDIDFGNLEGAVKGRKKISKMGNVAMAKDWHEKAFDYNNLLTVNYTSRDCLGGNVANYIDCCFGEAKKAKVKYDALIIALGNDELNISCFRSIIMDIRHELIRNTSQTIPTTIFVHIGDEKNAARLYWDRERDCASTFLDIITVVPYGFKQTVYTFEEIVDDRGALSMNYWYTKASGNLPTGRVANKYSEWARENCPDIYKKWSSQVAEAYYYTLGVLENAVSAACVKNHFLSEAQKVHARKTLSAAAEHRRWSRFQYVNGFEPYVAGSSAAVLSKAEKDRNLVHDMLCRFSDLQPYKQAYNHANGAQALEWERVHLFEECVISPNRNLTENELAFVETLLVGTSGTTLSLSPILDITLNELNAVYGGNNATWDTLKQQYSVAVMGDWLSENDLRRKLCFLSAAAQAQLFPCKAQTNDLLEQILAVSPLTILGRYNPRGGKLQTKDYTYPILWNRGWNDAIAYDYAYHLLWNTLEAAITRGRNLKPEIAQAINDLLATLLKRGQLSQEFVCKSGDYANFGGKDKVKMPDGVTMTRREELLRLYYIWRKTK